MRYAISMIAWMLLVSLVGKTLQSQTHVVCVIKIDGTINPAAAGYIHEGIQQAYENNAECLVIELNTPGGLLKSTRVIISDILASSVPVVVYVYPGGGQAASAGVFILHWLPMWRQWDLERTLALLIL